MSLERFGRYAKGFSEALVWLGTTCYSFCVVIAIFKEKLTMFEVLVIAGVTILVLQGRKRI